MAWSQERAEQGWAQATPAAPSNTSTEPSANPHSSIQSNVLGASATSDSAVDHINWVVRRGSISEDERRTATEFRSMAAGRWADAYSRCLSVLLRSRDWAQSRPRVRIDSTGLVRSTVTKDVGVGGLDLRPSLCLRSCDSGRKVLTPQAEIRHGSSGPDELSWRFYFHRNSGKPAEIFISQCDCRERSRKRRNIPSGSFNLANGDIHSCMPLARHSIQIWISGVYELVGSKYITIFSSKLWALVSF